MNKKTAPSPPETKTEVFRIAQVVFVVRDPAFGFRVAQPLLDQIKATTNRWVSAWDLPPARIIPYIVFDAQTDALVVKPPKVLGLATEWYWWMPLGELSQEPEKNFIRLWVSALRLSLAIETDARRWQELEQLLLATASR